MTPDLLNYLCCPECGADLGLEARHGTTSDRIEEGMLRCMGCGAQYPVRRGVPRFVRSDEYVRSFSYEWNKWSRVQLDLANHTTESEETFAEKTGFRPHELDGKVVLDAGCGAGRFLDVVSRWGARAIGVDFSFAVEAAYDNLKTRPNVDVVQADIFHLPFRADVFDAIFSIGVLHHTNDTRRAFLKLPRHLKPGGDLAVWLYWYPDSVYRRASDFWRAVFRHVPSRLLFAWCYALVVTLSRLYRQPFMSRSPWGHLRRVLPVNTHADFQWRVLDTFDWYSPRYQDKECSAPRVIGWFREAGFRNLQILDVPTAIRATRTADARIPQFRDPILDVRGKRLMVFGAGAGGAQALADLKRLGLSPNVVGVCDNDPAKAGSEFHGHLVWRFEDVRREEYDVVVIASIPGRAAIARQLEHAGLVEKRDFATMAVITDFVAVLREHDQPRAA